MARVPPLNIICKDTHCVIEEESVETTPRKYCIKCEEEYPYLYTVDNTQDFCTEECDFASLYVITSRPMNYPFSICRENCGVDGFSINPANPTSCLPQNCDLPVEAFCQKCSVGSHSQLGFNRHILFNSVEQLTPLYGKCLNDTFTDDFELDTSFAWRRVRGLKYFIHDITGNPCAPDADKVDQFCSPKKCLAGQFNLTGQMLCKECEPGFYLGVFGIPEDGILSNRGETCSQCTSEEGLLLVSELGPTCLIKHTECPRRTYKEYGICYLCSSGCEECSGILSFQCTKCIANPALIMNPTLPNKEYYKVKTPEGIMGGTFACMEHCPSYYNETLPPEYNCLGRDCDKTCEKCIGPTEIDCFECNALFPIAVEIFGYGGHFCLDLDRCPNTHTLHQPNNTCVCNLLYIFIVCNETCETCDGISGSDCTECNAVRVLYGGFCKGPCFLTSGTYLNRATGNCDCNI